MTALQENRAHFDRLASQISRLQKEIRTEFSATRSGIRAGDDDVKQVLREEFSVGNELLSEELRREYRVLYEDTIQRLKLLYEGRDPSAPPFPTMDPR